MSYVVRVWEQPQNRPLPASFTEAEQLLRSLDKTRPGQNPKFIRLAQRLMERYPFDESAMEESPGAWTDVELDGATGEAVYNIGLTSDLLEETRPCVVAEANALGLHVLDIQSGEIFLAGGGTPQTGDEPATAAAGDRGAHLRLGRAYRDGQGVKRNLAAAHALLSLAGAEAIEELAALSKTMKPGHIEFSRKLAQQMAQPGMLKKVLSAFEQANEKSYQAAYEAGRVDDYATALRHLQPLVANGHPDAQFMLGLMYTDGRGVEADAKQAFRLFHHSAQGGNVMAQHNTGHAYEHGQGVAQDIQQAIAWYTRAAKQGYQRSIIALNNLSESDRPASMQAPGVIFQSATHKVEREASGDLVIMGSMPLPRAQPAQTFERATSPGAEQDQIPHQSEEGFDGDDIANIRLGRGLLIACSVLQLGIAALLFKMGMAMGGGIALLASIPIGVFGAIRVAAGAGYPSIFRSVLVVLMTIPFLGGLLAIGVGLHVTQRLRKYT